MNDAITSRDLKLKDLNARIQAKCLKMSGLEKLSISGVKTTRAAFIQRRPELKKDTINMMLSHIRDLERYYIPPDLYMLLLPVMDGAQIREHIKTYCPDFKAKATTYHANNPAIITPQPIKRNDATDPAWDTIWARTITMEDYFRRNLIGFLTPAEALMHVTRYPRDIEYIPLDAVTVSKLLPTLDLTQLDVVTGLCHNGNPALVPTFAKLLNAGMLYPGKYRSHRKVVGLLDSFGYKILCQDPVPGALACASAATNPAAAQDADAITAEDTER